jgi:hypothetical protein
MTRARVWLWTTVLLTAGALVSAVALAPPAGAPPARALTWLLFTGSSVHVASTGWLFTVPEVRAFAREHAVRCLWAPAGLVILGAVTAAVVAPAAFRWLLLPYFGWQFYHYQKQNLGMAALAASAERVHPLLPAERRPLLLAGALSIAVLAAKPGLLGLRIAPFAHAALPLAGAAFGLAVTAGIAALARRDRSQRPAGFCLAYLVSLLFVLPVFCFASPYAAVGGMTVAHGLQYLLLVGLVAGGTPAGADPRAARSRLVRLSVLANIALIGGAALSGASHLHDGAAPWRLLFGAYLGVVMAHFVIDAGLWRMRDPLARRFVSTHLPYLVPGGGREPRDGAELMRLPMDRQPI